MRKTYSSNFKSKVAIEAIKERERGKKKERKGLAIMPLCYAIYSV